MNRQILTFGLILLSLLSCSREKEASKAVYNIRITNAVTTPNAAGDAPWNFCGEKYVGYASDADDRMAAMTSLDENGAMVLNAVLGEEAGTVWCYSAGAIYDPQTFTVPATVSKGNTDVAEDLGGMLFCTDGAAKASDITLRAHGLTAGLILNIYDSSGKYSGATVSGITLTSDKDPVAGSVELVVPVEQITAINNPQTTVSVAPATGTTLKVGYMAEPLQVGIVLIPCSFTGTVSVTTDAGVSTLRFTQPLIFEAGYVKTIGFDLAAAGMNGGLRVAVMGDSISSFDGYIPAGYAYYYPRSGSDVTSWDKTYWGVFTKEYCHGVLDVNSSWSGSCVAANAVRSGAFTGRVLDFDDPDILLLHGGSNDCQGSVGVQLGSYDYDSPLGLMDTYNHFRESYIYVIRCIQGNYPKAQIITIIGNRVTNDFAESILAISEHYGLPCVDFRPDEAVLLDLHPAASGHAYMARKIYEQNKDLIDR